MTKRKEFVVGMKGEVVQNYWGYIVERDGEDLIFYFESKPFVRKIRGHPKPTYYPYIDDDYTTEQTITVAPGQWLEGLVDGKWSYLSDADNRG